MSHELRSPLNAILGFAQLMGSDTPSPTPSRRRALTDSQAGWHLLALINDILDLAKVESGQVPLSPEPVSLAEVMLECQGMIEPQARHRGIELTFRPFDVPYCVRADRIRLKQVIINLLSNAIKYNVNQGKVAVECGAGAEGFIRVIIRDTGAGLRPEQLAQLFQAFNRLGQEAGGVEGTGIARGGQRLVELMGGHIGAESTVGVGSVFWFELVSTVERHLAVDESDPRRRPAAGASRRPAAHVALCRGQPGEHEVVEQLIARRPDMRLLSAAKGNLGVDLARAHRPT